MWIVKLGGSLANSDELILWLKALSKTPSVIVPGGGIFADGVRFLQNRWNFSEQTAHDMALLSMRQYGMMLSELGGFDTFDDIEQAHEAAIWLPNIEKMQASNIKPSWDITSDSLAAWLAGKLHAEHLLLVKSVEISSNQTSQKLFQQGIVDSAFGSFCQKNSFKSWICGSSNHVSLPNALVYPKLCFYEIEMT